MTFTGCISAYTDDVIQTMKDGALSWRKLFSAQLQAVEDKYSSKFDIDVDDLADMLSACLEGGILLLRILNEPQNLVKQILQYRDYLRLLYESS